MLFGIGYYYNQVNELSNSIVGLNDRIDKLTENNTQLRLNYVQYSKIKSIASNKSNTRFFATNTILKSPNKTRVVFYVSNANRYSISWDAESGVSVDSGNTSSGLVYIDVTYTGSGVRNIKCTNNKNNEVINIVCIGS